MAWHMLWFLVLEIHEKEKKKITFLEKVFEILWFVHRCWCSTMQCYLQTVTVCLTVHTLTVNQGAALLMFVYNNVNVKCNVIFKHFIDSMYSSLKNSLENMNP